MMLVAMDEFFFLFFSRALANKREKTTQTTGRNTTIRHHSGNSRQHSMLRCTRQPRNLDILRNGLT